MKFQLTYKLVLLLLVFSLGCSGGSSKEPSPLLKEAFELHKQALELEGEADKLLNNLPTTDQNRIKLEKRLADWNDNLIEVPGFEHEHHHHGHDHGHDHSHDHKPQIELSPEDMLAVQKEFLDSVRAIKADLLSLEQN